jgi:hypothetical protein
MAISVLGPLNKIIHDTTAEFRSKGITSNLADVVSTFVKTTLEAVDDILKKVQDLTEEEASP